MITTSKNPVLDFYTMAYVAGIVKRPVFKVLNMPSRDGKSLTSLRFANIEGVLVLAGDVTAQGFRNQLSNLHKKQKIERLVLIIVEDASKIRRKVREDFFALCTQFSTGIVNVEQVGMDFSFRTRASVVINTPPFFLKTLEELLLGSGSGDRFDIVRSELSEVEKRKLTILGDYNMPNPLEPITPPVIKEVDFPDYAEKHNEFTHNMIRCMYACHCAGLDENLIACMHNHVIQKCDWSGYWVNQVTPKDPEIIKFEEYERQLEKESEEEKRRIG